MQFSNKKMASMLGQNQTKARRWAKEFLPPDPERGLRSGKTRRHGLNDVFRVFLGGYLVSRMGFSIVAAKKILEDLAPWMAQEGLLPKRTGDYAPKHQGKRVRHYDVYIMLTGLPRFFWYECRGVIRERKGLDGIVQTEYAVEHLRGTWVEETSPIIDHARILRISNLLYRFKAKLSLNGT